MPKKPSPKPSTKSSEDFGLPSPAALQRADVISGAISKIIADDEAIAAFHHKMVHHGIGCRVGLALALASDKQAFANFAKDTRIKALPRPPKDTSDILRCLFQATYLDPKKASKYYKRIEPLWIKRCSAAEVLAFLDEHGVSKPSPKTLPGPSKPGVGKPASTSVKADKSSKKSADDTSGRVLAATLNEGDTPCGTFYFWPGKITVGRFYDLRVKIVAYDGEGTIFDLYDVTRSSVSVAS